MTKLAKTLVGPFHVVDWQIDKVVYAVCGRSFRAAYLDEREIVLTDCERCRLEIQCRLLKDQEDHV